MKHKNNNILLWVAYIVIGCSFLTSLLLYIFLTCPDTKNFFMSMTTEFLGAFLTVFLIDYAIKFNAKKERQKILSTVFVQISNPLNRHFRMFLWIYKATRLVKPENVNLTYKDIFESDDFYSNIQCLDFLKDAPVIPNLDWAAFLAAESEKFKEDIELILNKYAYFLDNIVIKQLEDLKSNLYLSVFSSIPTTQYIDRTKGYRREYKLIVCGPVTDSIKEQLKRIFSLIDYFQNITKEKFDYILNDTFWREDVAPKIGSGR